VRELVVVHLDLTHPEREVAIKRLLALGMTFQDGVDVPALRVSLSPRGDRLAAPGRGAQEQGDRTRLGISERTAKFHVLSLFNKLAVNTRVPAVAAAARYGLLCIALEKASPTPSFG
jgi:DNA-binding CsgD family transcriptional regulator